MSIPSSNYMPSSDNGSIRYPENPNTWVTLFSPEEDIAAVGCNSPKAFQQPHENLQLDSSVCEIITGYAAGCCCLIQARERWDGDRKSKMLPRLSFNKEGAKSLCNHNSAKGTLDLYRTRLKMWRKKCAASEEHCKHGENAHKQVFMPLLPRLHKLVC